MYCAKLKKYDGDITPRAKNSRKVSYVTECGEESKVQHHFQDACDINKMINNPNASMNPQQQERFGDFADMLDLAGNMQRMVDARNLFDSLPTDLRKEVGHTVEGLFDFINQAATNDEVKEKCYKYGLFERKKEPEIPTVRVEGFAPQADKKGNLKKTKVSTDTDE